MGPRPYSRGLRGLIRRLPHLLKDWRSNAAYRRFQRERDAERKAAEAAHGPTRHIDAKRTAAVHAALARGVQR